MGAVKILVVDDERAVRESLRRALELEGYEIELAADGQEALQRLEANCESSSPPMRGIRAFSRAPRTRKSLACV